MRIERFDLGAYENARVAQRAAMAGQVDTCLPPDRVYRA